MEQETKEKGKFIAFVVLTSFCLGLANGLWFASWFFTNKMNEAVEMKRMMHNKAVYDIMPFDKTSK